MAVDVTLPKNASIVTTENREPSDNTPSVTSDAKRNNETTSDMEKAKKEIQPIVDGNDEDKPDNNEEMKEENDINSVLNKGNDNTNNLQAHIHAALNVDEEGNINTRRKINHNNKYWILADDDDDVEDVTHQTQ